MIKHRKIRNRVAHIIISFFTIALLVPPYLAAATKSPSLSDASDSSGRLPGDVRLESENPLTGILNASGVNIRQGPGLTERIIGNTLQQGDILEIFGISGHWVEVSAKDARGWVYGEYIDIEDAARAENEKTTTKAGRQVTEPASNFQTEIAQTQDPEGTTGGGADINFADKRADLLQAYTLALKKDPTFRGERYRFEASPEIVKQALSELFPSVNLDAYYTDTRTEIFETTVAVYGETLAKYPSKGYNLRLTQPIFEYAAFMRVSQAKEEAKSAAFAFEAAKQDLISRVADAYIEVLAAHDDLEFTRAEEEGLRFHFELARERYRSGLAPVTDFHDAKARYAYVTAKRVEAESGLDDALEALAEITGERIEQFAQFKFEPAGTGEEGLRAAGIEQTETPGQEPPGEAMPLVDPDPDDVNDWIDAALKQNLQVQIREQGVRIAEREVARQRSGHLPTLEFVARVFRDDEGGSLFGGSSDVETKEALLRANVPIFEGGAVVSKTREALKHQAAAKEDLEKELRAVKREAMAAFLGVKTAIKNTAALEQSVVSARIALEAKREGYKSGLFPSLVVSDAERDHYMARRDFAKAHYEYIRNSLRLKKAVSTLTEADLAGINQWLK